MGQHILQAWGKSQELQDLVRQRSAQDEPHLRAALRESLEALEKTEPRKAEIVKLRIFAGMTLAEVAETLGISQTTASRQWAEAKQWLFANMHRERET